MLLDKDYEGWAHIKEGCTYCFELVYYWILHSL